MSRVLGTMAIWGAVAVMGWHDSLLAALMAVFAAMPATEVLWDSGKEEK